MGALDALVLLPAGVCVGCAARGARPGRVPGTVAAVLMLVAMLDTGIGPGVLPAPVWSVVLTAAGIALAVAGRVAAPVQQALRVAPTSTAGAARHVQPAHAGHGAVGLVLMAALLLGMPMGDSAPMPGMARMGPSPLAALLLTASAVFAVASAVVVLHERSTPRRIESGAMAVSVALMALPLAL